MTSVCFDEQTYKRLLPIPKTHLFMKKITRIQAIDRQMRKKWMQIKKDNDKKDFSIIKNDEFSPLTIKEQSKNTEISFQPSKDHSKISSLQNNLKRNHILNNHRRHEQIFYRRKNKQKYESNLKDQTFDKISSKNLLIQTFDSPVRRIKTQMDVKYQQVLSKSQQKCNYTHKELKKQELKSQHLSPNKLLQNQSRSPCNKSPTKLPFMLLRRGKHKERQSDILVSKSQQQLVQLSQKSKHNMKIWASQRISLYHKLKGSHAYYIMKNPTRLEEIQNVYYP